MAAIGDKKLWYDARESAYWSTVVTDEDTDRIEISDPLDGRGSMATISWSRSVASGLSEDLAVIDLHMVGEPSGGAPFTPLSATQASDAETDIANWWTNTKPKVSADWTMKDVVWRNFGMSYPIGTSGLSKPGPIWRRSTFNVVGTGSTTRLPDQVALTTTFRTASRRHWGRVYIGGFTSSSLGAATKGHMTTTDVDAIALAMRSLLNDLYGNTLQTQVIVWSPRYRGIFSIRELDVDDTFDVIRRRRPKAPSYRKVYTS